jgi:hypothetical protein
MFEIIPQLEIGHMVAKLIFSQEKLDGKKSGKLNWLRWFPSQDRTNVSSINDKHSLKYQTTSVLSQIVYNKK